MNDILATVSSHAPQLAGNLVTQAFASVIADPALGHAARELATIAIACRAIGVTEQTYYRWRREYGGLKTDQGKRLKELERENQRLRKAVSDLTLDKLILAEAAKETSKPQPS